MGREESGEGIRRVPDGGLLRGDDPRREERVKKEGRENASMASLPEYGVISTAFFTRESTDDDTDDVDTGDPTSWHRIICTCANAKKIG